LERRGEKKRLVKEDKVVAAEEGEKKKRRREQQHVGKERGTDASPKNNKKQALRVGGERMDT